MKSWRISLLLILLLSATSYLDSFLIFQNTASAESPQSSSPLSEAEKQEKSGDISYSQQDYAAAENSYLKALEIDPGLARIPPKLGIVYVLMHKYDQAEAMLKKSVQLFPKNAQIIANYASVLLINKKPDDAIGAAKLSLQIEPDPKTYITLGQAYQALNNPEMAEIAFEKGLLLGQDDPEVKRMLAELKVP